MNNNLERDTGWFQIDGDRDNNERTDQLRVINGVLYRNIRHIGMTNESSTMCFVPDK